MRKELITYIETNEQGEEVSLQRVTADKDYVLLKLGGLAVAINKFQLAEALNALSFYGQSFDQEAEVKANKAELEESRRLARLKQELEPQPPTIVLSDRDFDKVEAELANPTPPNEKLKSTMKKHTAKLKEDEDSIVLDVPNRVGLSASELKLKAMMENVIGNGPSLELTDKTKE